MDAKKQNGKRFDRYTVLGKLGRGGMGVVYKAYEESLGRKVALKMLPAKYAQNPKVVERFQLEARTSAKLSHPGITPIYAVGEYNGTHFIAMEYVRGQTLWQRIQEKGPLDVAEALIILRDVADALREAHQHRILHRDIKPGNIMLDHRRRVKVMDFGLARVSSETSQLSDDHAKLGTPAYMSPEQCEGKPLDVRTDIYSLGVTLYEMLTGQLPFQGENAQAIMFNIVQGKFPDIQSIRPDVPDGVRQLIRNMVATDPVNRYESVRSLMADVQHLIDDPNFPIGLPGGTPPPAKRVDTSPTPAKSNQAPKMIAAVLFLLVSISAAAFALLRNPSEEFEPGTPVERRGDSEVRAPASTGSDGLVAYWPFDEGSGRVTIDSVGKRSGALESAVWTKGVRGGGLEIQAGAASYVRVPHYDALSPTGAVTMTAWVKLYDFPRTFHGIIFKAAKEPVQTYADRVYSLWAFRQDQGTRGLHIASAPEGASGQIYDSTGGLSLNLHEWVHVAGVLDAAEREMSMYFNGDRVDIRAYNGDALRGGDGPLLLGGILQKPGELERTAGSMAGVLDEVRIYNRALTADEIAADFARATPTEPTSGAIVFADKVVRYTPGRGVEAPYDNPRRALSDVSEPPTQEHFVSLGEQGQIVLEFTDNALVCSGDSAADLWIYEHGTRTGDESVSVSIGTNPYEFMPVGTTQMEFSGIDIDAYIGHGIVPTQQYRYVLIQDIDGRRDAPKSGADINAVAALSWVAIR